ncbi:MAG: hypothetical protein F9K32_19265 [Desulfobulbaceae bacterium]|nr:MAG: hypothetical protein F9K32_19265 [Desulfobulbaceae bacterium]
MIFCKECGEALNLFETHDEDVCYSCLRLRLEPAKPPVPPPPAAAGNLFPPGATLSREQGSLVLRSPEGWVLWSGPDSERHSLEAILSRAQRIDAIRRKRKR